MTSLKPKQPNSPPAIRLGGSDTTPERWVPGDLAAVQGPAAGACGILINIDELATRLAVAKGTLYNWVYLKRIPYVRAGRCLRFDPQAVFNSLRHLPTIRDGRQEVEGAIMAIYQRREAGVWYADFYANGKREQVSTGTKNKREAEKFFALRVSETERGEYSRPVKVTLSEFGQQYMEYAKANKRSWLRDEQIMVHLNAAFGSMQLSDIGPFPIERYKIERAKIASPATVNREIALLKHMFNLAEQWAIYRGRNPMKGVRFLSEDNLQFRSLSDAEEATLIRHCSPYLQDLVTFAINTGFRFGDILDLKWEDVDIENNTIKTLVKKTGQMLDMPLNDSAATVIRGWRGIRRTQYVFYNPETGEQWKDLWLGLKKACRKAGLLDVTWHTFRHTFASRLTRAGVDLVSVKELLGHSSITVTMRYAHTNRDAKARAVDLLGKRSDKTVTLPHQDRKRREMA